MPVKLKPQTPSFKPQQNFKDQTSEPIACRLFTNRGNWADRQQR